MGCARDMCSGLLQDKIKHIRISGVYMHMQVQCFLVGRDKGERFLRCLRMPNRENVMYWLNANRVSKSVLAR